MNIKDLITVREVSEILGVCPITIRNWHANGSLIPVFVHKLTGIRFYDKEEISGLMVKRNSKRVKEPSQLSE